jgi:Flp pilus assembly secretin CpaC
MKTVETVKPNHGTFAGCCRFEGFSFGSIRIDGVTYEHDAVAVNKAVVIRLPKKATKVAVTQPKIAEVEVVSPDTVLIHGRAVGTTSLVIWFEGR